jgi:hypothetical protein
MRKILLPMMALLLTGCVNDSASYYIDGRDHALTLLRAQKYFWSDAATLTLVVARLPDCQRRHELTLAPAASVDIDVFASGDASWTLRSGSTLWRVDTSTCAISAAGADALGPRVGSFKVVDRKLRFAIDRPAALPAR